MSSITENWQKSMATFLANEINATDRRNGTNRASPNYVSFKDKNIN